MDPIVKTRKAFFEVEEYLFLVDECGGRRVVRLPSGIELLRGPAPERIVGSVVVGDP